MKKIISIILVCFILMIGSAFYLNDNGKEITVYTTQENEDIELLVDAFKEAHPDIKLNIVKGSTGTIIAKLLLEKDNPQCDVIWNVVASGLLELDKEDILYPYKPSGIEKIDPKFYDTKSPIPKWVGATVWAGVISVNTEEAKKKNIPIPESYADLTKPIYKDEIVMPDPIASGTGYMMINSWLQNGRGWDFIDALNKNIKYYTSSGSAPSKSTAIGEQVVGVSYDKPSLKLAKDVKQMKVIFPKDGLPWEIDATALVNKKHIKPEAKLFYDWAVSEDVMDLYLNSRIMNTLKGSKLTNDVPSNIKDMLNKCDFHWAADNKKKICDEWAQRYGERK